MNCPYTESHTYQQQKIFGVIARYNNYMQQFLTILSFYRPFVIWSLIVNIAIAIVYPFVIPAIITKIFLTIFVWFMFQETKAKRKLTFCKNLGVSPIKLFSSLFLLDITATIGFIEIIKEFI